MSVEIETEKIASFNWMKTVWLFVGIGLFALVYYSPVWPDAIDPLGKQNLQKYLSLEFLSELKEPGCHCFRRYPFAGAVYCVEFVSYQ